MKFDPAALIGIFGLIVPEMILVAAACLFFLGGAYGGSRRLWGTLSLVALAAAGLALAVTAMPHGTSLLEWPRALWTLLGRAGTESFPISSEGNRPVYLAAIIVDRLALFIKAVALAGGVILVLVSWDEAAKDAAGEHFACLLLMVAGLSLTGCANELVTLFLALELISIPTYVLLYLGRSDQTGQEATVKYFFLSILSSAFLLFGFSYLYGLAGTTNLAAILQSGRSSSWGQLSEMALVALVMISAGLGFRITAVPFHFYAPDVYQGTSLSNAALLAFIPKVAGFTAFIRLLGFISAGENESGLVLGEQGPMLFYILAAVTMSIGNLLALLQNNLKRLLAYSSVAHAGYMLMGLSIAPMLHRDSLPGGIDAILFYLVAYGSMTIGAFAVLAALNTPERPVETVDDLAGLSRSHPMLAILMAVCLFSLIGVPLTAGFAGKFLLFMGAIMPTLDAYPWMFRVLALVAAINAAVGGWYYLRVLAVMFLRTPVKALPPSRSRAAIAGAMLCVILTLFFGIYPMPLGRITRSIIASPVPAAAVRAEH
ncbi:MAG TPA: NADH-quinone oxidoreductase subunit N [Gemmataceae bacterium]|nr:NADH-quinone oxidoreductase subunit N [Gemmataceae bacterium]